MLIFDFADCNFNEEEGTARFLPMLRPLNPEIHFPVYFDKLLSFLSSLFEIVEDKKHGELTSEIKLMLSNQIESECESLSSLLEGLDEEGKEILMFHVTPLFQIPNLQIALFSYIFPVLSSGINSTKASEIFIKPLQRIYDNVQTVEDVSLLQHSFLSKALSAFGQYNFLQHLMPSILDTLITSNKLASNDITWKACSRSTSVSNDITLKSESLVSYEVSPLIGETDSLSSLHLEQMFSDPILKLEMTHSFIDLSDDIIDLEADQESPNSLPVFSAQEIDSVDGNLIDINRTEVASLNFIDQDDKQLTPTKENTKVQPFTVMLGGVDSTLEKHYDEHVQEFLEEHVEEIPKTIANSVNNGSQNIKVPEKLDLYQTVAESVKWLIPWLGPRLTTEYITSPLLKRLSKILLDIDLDDNEGDSIDNLIDRVSSITDCLTEVVYIYGDNIVLYQYLPHVARLVSCHQISLLILIKFKQINN